MIAADEEQKKLAERRLDLEKKLRQKGALESDETGKDFEKTRPNIGQAVKLASEFLSAVVVGILLGLGFDQLTGLSPWGLVVFLFLGFAAGIVNMLRNVGHVTTYYDKQLRGDE